jgi:hypothetical protein
MTPVETGWCTDENPVTSKLLDKTPLSCEDGSDRVLDVISFDDTDKPLFGVFVKDFRKYPW